MFSVLRKLFNRLRKPADPAIRLTDDGFDVVDGDSIRQKVRWSDVREIFAFKLDRLTVDCICLGFRVTDTSDYVPVDEEMPGYAEMVEAMQRVFPDYNKEWWTQVAFPAFATNFTPVWGKPLP